MCRLFGFRSVIPSQVHRSLLSADNALGVQSDRHPDGWGVAYYVEGAPHVTRSSASALSDQIFHRLSGVVASETVLAHVRKATRGPKTVLNCHPFQHGRWTFAHNGDVVAFDRHREALLSEVSPRLRRYVLGETDSEVLFFLFLTRLSRHGPLARPQSVTDVITSLGEVLALVRDRADTTAERSTLTVMVTDGDVLAAVQGGKELHFSTHKTRCADRDHCPSHAPECEAPSASGHVNHLIVSSEPLQGENVWLALSEDETVAVDHRMRVVRGPLGRRPLPVVA